MFNNFVLSVTSLCSKAQCAPLVLENKAFVGLRSCDNVQTETSIFKYANWSSMVLPAGLCTKLQSCHKLP